MLWTHPCTEASGSRRCTRRYDVSEAPRKRCHPVLHSVWSVPTSGCLLCSHGTASLPWLCRWFRMYTGSLPFHPLWSLHPGTVCPPERALSCLHREDRSTKAHRFPRQLRRKIPAVPALFSRSSLYLWTSAWNCLRRWRRKRRRRWSAVLFPQHSVPCQGEPQRLSRRWLPDSWCPTDSSCSPLWLRVCRKGHGSEALFPAHWYRPSPACRWSPHTAYRVQTSAWTPRCLHKAPRWFRSCSWYLL